MTLSLDQLLSENDRKSFKLSLQEKRNGILVIKEREEENIRNTKAFVEEIKNAQERFYAMIHLLEKKNLEAATRKSYMRLIETLDAKIPELDNLFLSLSTEFKKNIANIKDAFYLLNMSIKNDLVDSLENQQRLGEILGIESESVLQRIACNREILDGKSSEFSTYEIDLGFLDI